MVLSPTSPSKRNVYHDVRCVILRPGARPVIPTYESMGVRTLINCQGAYTIISGSLALNEVQVMSDATREYVHMDELMECAGARLAERTGAEWGLVRFGCVVVSVVVLHVRP